jgi:mRNA interferase RelE/StbE
VTDVCSPAIRTGWGKPLEAPFDDVWTTRRGDYRALYSIDDRKHAITVLAVAHRRDAYRPR